jgi:hypothetical protein
MIYRNKQQNSALHALISDLNINAEQKEELVFQYTNERTTSSSKMLITECQSLINHLNSIKKGFTAKPNAWKETPANTMRRKILSICHEMKWTISGKVDYAALDVWLLKFGKFHKKLNDLTAEELPAQVTQFEELLKKYYAKG